MVEVLAKIIAKRSQDIATKGLDFGHTIPQNRIHPLIPPKLDKPLIITEIKRASPSAGHIGDIHSVTHLAQSYLNGGASAISVLCEERHFNGSLRDLMQVKNAYPNACVLRKDFIQDSQEIEISYRAGADMVLLIAAMFIDEKDGFLQLQKIYEKCLSFGITPLLEVHNQREIDFITPLQPALVGVNSRNLHTFEIDIPSACVLRQSLQDSLPTSKVIFESGIDSASSGFMVGSLGFNGLLCGSYLVAHKNPTHAIQSLKKAFELGFTQKPRFYNDVFHKWHKEKILVKICGITSLDDALQIGELGTYGGVDMLGFILAKNSPRFIKSKQIQNIAKALQKLYPHILRIAVVNDKHSLNTAKILYKEGYIDGIQLHSLNPQTPKMYANTSLEDALYCYYVAQNVENLTDFSKEYAGAFCLIDSKSIQGGGSGKSVAKDVLLSLKERYLCVAGGINPQNLKSFLALKPSLLDINSGVEKSAGLKDINAIQQILNTLESSHNPKAI